MIERPERGKVKLKCGMTFGIMSTRNAMSSSIERLGDKSWMLTTGEGEKVGDDLLTFG